MLRLSKACLGCGLILVGARGPAEAAQVVGQAVTTRAHEGTFAVTGAAIELADISPESAVEPRSVSTGVDGVFRFSSVRDGCYVITGRAEGLTGQSEPFCIEAQRGPPPVVVQMRLEVVVETIEVSAAAITIDPTQTSSVGALSEATIDNAPKANRSYEDALALIPGVFRGPSGELTSNGARTSQSGARLNGADVTDPFTGRSEVNLPADVVSRVEILTSPYDTEYGGFTGALSSVETKSSNMAKLDLKFQNFNPRLRKRDGSVMGIESATPRLTVTGPLKKGKLAFLHSTEYQFVRAEQEDAGLDPLARDVEREALSVFTQLDARLIERNSLTLNVLAFPEKNNFFGLNAFQPQESTPDLRRRGFLTTLRDVQQYRGGATLVSQFDWQNLGATVLPRGTGDYRVGLERAEGSFYHRQQRDSQRIRWSEIFRLKPRNAWGEHQLKTGVSVVREDIRAHLAFKPITWLGADGRPVRRMTFGPAADMTAARTDSAAFLQDKWMATPTLTLDLGLRLERDSITARWNPSYRSGFAYSFGGSRTVLRGGAGIFFARTSLAVPTFSMWPARTDTIFSSTNNQELVTAYNDVTPNNLRTPKTLGWSLQVDRDVTQDLSLRLGYQQRRTTQSILVERSAIARGLEALALNNRGRDSYREWQLTARHRLGGRGHITGSYVRSSAVGDLNDLSSLFGVAPATLIQPNERAPLAFDAPNRLVVWADVRLPWALRATPVLEVRQGFPYSLENELRQIVEARNRGGRFPAYKALDLQITKRFTLNFGGKERKVRLGVRIFNLTNSFNPLDVQSNLSSPFFGTYYRGVKRRLRGVLEIGN